jgi:hypothetical protein
MQKLTITRTNGNIVRSLSGEDHISGLCFYSNSYPDADQCDSSVTPLSASNPIAAISSIETAEKYGIKADATSWEIRVLHYQLTSIFNQNSGISLYVGIYTPETGTPLFEAIKKMQNYTGGKLRQIGVWDGTREFTSTNAESILNSLKSVRTTLEAQNKPLVILYAPRVVNYTSLPTGVAASGREGVSVIIAQDGSGTAYDLYNSSDNSNLSDKKKNSVTSLGDVLGILSSAKVHHSIAWVESYPSNIALPALSDGTELRTLDSAVIETLDSDRYLFVITYDGLGGTYWQDSHNMDLSTSDYAYIESVRTMDKAVRGVRTYTLPKLGKPLAVDASTGKLETYVVEDLELTGGKALEDMEKAGELSGYKVTVDPDQDVLSTSRVRMVITNVATGVMRNLDVEIGYGTSV